LGRTNEALWKRIIASVKAGSKGGKPGQWSARKAQLATLLYKKAGGRYSGPKTKAQKSLSKWTKQKWRTSDGKPAARKGGTTRYLPDAAWKRLSPSQKAATNRKKQAGSRAGRQFVSNTKAAKAAGKSARGE
jgi:site-specific DNA-cytosine methylase